MIFRARSSRSRPLSPRPRHPFVGAASEVDGHGKGTKIAEKSVSMDRAIRDLRIKVSGCFNSCGQHHVADIGFYGNSRNVGGYTVPHFQVMLGGQWDRNAGSYALALGAVPSKKVNSRGEPCARKGHASMPSHPFLRKARPHSGKS